MRQLVLLSGKGGTGKTSVTAAIAHLASAEASVILVDADVDGANLELIVDPQPIESHPFMGGQVAVIDPLRCTQCGLCLEVCRFSAVLLDADGYRVDPAACEGCAACHYRCPDDAIRMVPQQAGLWFRSETRFGPLLHARLFAGRENSGKLVTEVREQARRVCLATEGGLVVIDGPPGISCPSIAASTGVDMALLVAEPTVSGMHDLQRTLAMLEHFQVSALVLVNKADINLRHAEAIAALCRERGVATVGEIPYDPVVTRAMLSGDPVTVYEPAGVVAAGLRAVWNAIKETLMPETSADPRG